MLALDFQKEQIAEYADYSLNLSNQEEDKIPSKKFFIHLKWFVLFQRMDF